MSIKHVTELYCSDIIKSIVGAPFSLVGTEGIHCTETWRAWVLTWGPFLHVIPPPSDPLSSDITQSVLSIKIFKKAPPKNYTQSVVDYFTDQMTSDFSLHHNMTSLNIVFLHPFLQVAALLHALTTVHHNKRKKAHIVQHTKHKEFLQQKKKREEAKLKRHKEARKKLYRVMGQMDQKRQRSSLKGAPQDD